MFFFVLSQAQKFFYEPNLGTFVASFCLAASHRGHVLRKPQDIQPLELLFHISRVLRMAVSKLYYNLLIGQTL